jgi:hypothetical protein
MKRPGSVSSCSRKTPSSVIFAADVAGRRVHETPMATGQLAPWRGRRTTRTSWAEVLAAELRADAGAAGDFEHLLLHREVAERMAVLVARSGQRVEVFGRRAASASSCAISALVPPITIARW